MSSRTKRRHIVDDPSDGSSHQFPAALLNIPDSASTSPTKAVKKMAVVPSRKPRTQGKTKTSGHETLPNAHEGSAQPPEADTPIDAEPQATVPLPSLGITDNDVAAFTDAVNAYTAGFYHLEQKIFVVQGYSTEKQQSLVCILFLHEWLQSYAPLGAMVPPSIYPSQWFTRDGLYMPSSCR